MPWKAKPMAEENARGRSGRDYSAARLACGKYVQFEGGDLSAKLEDALRSGWSMSLTRHGAWLLSLQIATGAVAGATS